MKIIFFNSRAYVVQFFGSIMILKAKFTWILLSALRELKIKKCSYFQYLCAVSKVFYLNFRSIRLNKSIYCIQSLRILKIRVRNSVFKQAKVMLSDVLFKFFQELWIFFSIYFFHLALGID